MPVIIRTNGIFNRTQNCQTSQQILRLGEEKNKIIMIKNAQKEEETIEFDWVKLQTEMDALNPTETRKEKLFRKIGENPLVPIGCLATTAALCYGLWSFRTGNRRMSQYMMRTRIAAQGFTVVALIIGIGLGASKAAKK